MYNSDRRPKAEREGYTTSQLEHPFWAVTVPLHVIPCHFFVSKGAPNPVPFFRKQSRVALIRRSDKLLVI
jgi:hypothetical protein